MSARTALLVKSVDVSSLDPYLLMAYLGKRVIHPGGRKATGVLFQRAGIRSDHQVLDVGCGVATTTVEITRRTGCQVTDLDISDLMLQRAKNNVKVAGVEEKVKVGKGDILALRFADCSFDRVIAEAVTMFVDRSRAARELVRVCRPGGMVLATEFLWRRPPTLEARHLGE